MKKILAPAIIATAAILSLAAKTPKDPILMEIDGQPVTLSEFEYLYHKNQDQQLEQESVDQYLQRFIDYKLKVTQARHERQDTTAEYKKEFKAYRAELAAPFLSDTLEEQRLIDEAFNHMLFDINLDHIMLPTDNPQKADSIRSAAINAETREAFLQLAKQYSTDPSLPNNGGQYGWIKAGIYPYEWEEAAYNTPIDSISPVTQTQFGLHILRINNRRPVEGEVSASHILISFDALNGDTIAAKAKADSIYNLLISQQIEFPKAAETFSNCPSAAEGGSLGYFARGVMVPQFETVIFDQLSNGEISKPFKTRFGYHIAQRHDIRKPNKKQAEAEIRAQMKRDGRAARPRQARAQQLRKTYNARIDQNGKNKLTDAIQTLGYDSVTISLKNDLTPLMYVADSTITIADFLATKPRMNPRDPQIQQLDRLLNGRLTMATLSYENNHLEQNYPEFANLSREYSEGLMLFASMDQNVWKKPQTDPQGLQQFFQQNYQNYNNWTAPRWKGYVIYSTEDSIIQQVDKFLTQNQPSPDSLGQILNREFPRSIKIERIVLPQGQNPLVDHVAFGAPKYTPANRWKYYVTYLGHIINAPEEVADVRALVTADWIEQLEKQWVEQLRQRYPVTVNQKVLKKVK